MAKPSVRTQDPYIPLTKAQFHERFFARFYDPAFDKLQPELEKIFETAWDGYENSRKAPRTAFAVVVHGDSAGPENLRRMLADWLTDMGLIQAGPLAVLDTWIGWYKPYATSHEELDQDQDVFVQVQNAALSLADMVQQIRRGAYRAPHQGLHRPRQK